MKNKNLDLILINAFFYATSVVFMIGIAYIILSIIGFSDDSLFRVMLFLAILSLVIGYYFSKSVLEPLFDRNEKLDTLLKETLHELKISVTTIISNADMLKKEIEDPKNLKRIQRIHRASKLLLGEYSDMEFSIRKQIIGRKKEQFSLASAIEDILYLLEDENHSIKFIKEIEETYIFSDRGGFLKVIKNLLQNSIKYNKPNGFVKITLKNGEFIVSDGGIGIKESDMLRIFDRYYQSNSYSPGFGIGLGFVKEFCDEEGVKIHIKSKEGEGTTIKLDIHKILVEKD